MFSPVNSGLYLKKMDWNLNKEDSQMIFESIFFREEKLREIIKDLRNQNMVEASNALQDKVEKLQELRFNIQKQSNKC
jgi:hypothetical protein